MTNWEDEFTDQPPDEEVESTYDGGGMEIPWRLAAFLALAIIVIVFAVQNTQEVELRFLGWTWQIPLVLVIVFSVAISVLAEAVLGGIVKRRRARRQWEREELRRLRGEG